MYAILNNYIKQEQYDEYVYALEIILNILITDITMIIIGLAMGMIWECILFWLVYKILRKYCGGYHFSTSLKCYLSSCIMCPVVLAVVRYVPYSMTVWGLLTLTALIILSILSPVEAANKPLDEKEQRIFGITARILIIISAVCWSVTAIVFRQLILSKIISLSIISVAVFVIAGKMYLTVRNTIKNYPYPKKDKGNFLSNFNRWGKYTTA